MALDRNMLNIHSSLANLALAAAETHGIRWHIDSAGRVWLEERWTRLIMVGTLPVTGAAWIPAPRTYAALRTWLGY